MKRKTLKNLSPRYILEIVIANKNERREIGKEREREDLLIVNEEWSQAKQLSVIAARLFADGLDIYDDRTSKEGRAVFVDNLMRLVLDWLEIQVFPKCCRQLYEFDNSAPAFHMELEFNSYQAFEERNRPTTFRGRCRRNDDKYVYDPSRLNPNVETTVEISITHVDGSLKTTEEIFQIFFHETTHEIVEAISPIYGFWRKKEFNTMVILYEDLILHLLETCWIWK